MRKTCYLYPILFCIGLMMIFYTFPCFQKLQDSVTSSYEDAEGTLILSPEDSFFKGHFPNNPVFPGVLMISALAEVALKSWKPDLESGLYLHAFKKVRFHLVIKPPVVLKIHVDLSKAIFNNNLYEVKAILLKDTEMVASAVLIFGEKPLLSITADPDKNQQDFLEDNKTSHQLLDEDQKPIISTNQKKPEIHENCIEHNPELYVPHRDPFLFLTSLTSWIPHKEIFCFWNIDAHKEYLSPTYEGEKQLSLPIMVEAIAQATTALYFKSHNLSFEDPKTPPKTYPTVLFAAISEAKMHRTLFAPCSVNIEVVIKNQRENLCIAQGKVFDRFKNLVAEAEIKAFLKTS